ncbi:hypothetical protein BD779DRAFT_1541106 [Infundibulicybe gibba]|nr:hypothetical protein BD779DRAFT_1541106 [Infundibulicybe gibba]
MGNLDLPSLTSDRFTRSICAYFPTAPGPLLHFSAPNQHITAGTLVKFLTKNRFNTLESENPWVLTGSNKYSHPFWRIASSNDDLMAFRGFRCNPFWVVAISRGTVQHVGAGADFGTRCRRFVRGTRNLGLLILSPADTFSNDAGQVGDKCVALTRMSHTLVS